MSADLAPASFSAHASMRTGAPDFLRPNFESIPTLLKTFSAAVWRGERRDNGKVDKAPRNPLTGCNVATNDLLGWGSFAEAQAAYISRESQWDGVGVLMEARSGIVGIDLDGIEELQRQQPSIGELLGRAQGAGLYCERSPSGNGLRLFVRGSLPGHRGRRRGGIELYSESRFLTVTGRAAWLGDVVDGQWLVDELLRLVGPDLHPAPAFQLGATEAPRPEPVQRLADWARNRHTRLWSGEWQETGDDLSGTIGVYPSQSEADFALVGHIAREAARQQIPVAALESTVMAVFTQSGLYRPEKRARVQKYDIPKVVADAIAAEDPSNRLAQAQPGPHLEPGAAGPNNAGFATTMWLAEMNRRYAWIEAEAGIYRLQLGDFIDPSKFRLQHDNHLVAVSNGTGTKRIGSGTAWLRDPQRAQFPRLVLRPAEPEVTADGCLNEWKGYAVKPRQGSVRPFTDLLKRLVPDRRARTYVLEWFAHLIQKPGNKIFVSLVFWSHAQGVGKNLLFECLLSLIGEVHSTLIGQRELVDDFTAWIPRRVLVIGDEVSSHDKRQYADKLKGWITGTLININQKHQPVRTIPNHLNFIFLSNHADALFLDDHDRRYFVWDVKAGQLPTTDAKAFVRWRDNGGLEALRHFLESIDVSRFDPTAPAPMTTAKREMVEDNRSDLERWFADLMASNIAQVLGREVVTAHELAQQYRNAVMDGKGQPPSAKAVTSACKRLGAYARPNQVRMPNGEKRRALALANQSSWETRPEADWATELQKGLKYV